MEFEKSCGAIVFRRENGKIFYLLLQYENYWGFPKGLVEKGETEIETASREIEEETGIKDLKFLDGFREKISYFYRLKGKLIKKEVIFFLAETKTKGVKISFEHIGYKWLMFDEAVKTLTHKNSKELLKKADEFIKKQKGISDFVG